jgi:hypothetical protein
MPYGARSIVSFVAARTTTVAASDEASAADTAGAEPARTNGAGRVLPSTPPRPLRRWLSSGIGSSAHRLILAVAHLNDDGRGFGVVVSERQDTPLTPALRERRVLNRYRSAA